MARGKASKRRRAQRRQAPPVRSRQTVDRRRWVLIAVGAAVVVAAGVGTVLALIGDDATLETGSTLPHAAEASAVFEGVPQNGVALGRPDAPVTLLEFVDLQCPFCRDFALQ